MLATHPSARRRVYRFSLLAYSRSEHPTKQQEPLVLFEGFFFDVWGFDTSTPVLNCRQRCAE